jgi:hypothetical protein
VAFAGQVEDTMRVLTAVDHVIWVTVGEYEEQQAEVNAVLRAALPRHRNLVLLDWNTVWEEHPAYTGSDGLHLTPEGAAAYAEFVAKGVRRVTRLADISPAPGVEKPQIFTKGSVPASTGSRPTKRSSGSTSSGSTKRRRTTTTAPHRTSDPSDGQTNPSPSTPTVEQPVETSPPATQPPATQPPVSQPPSGGPTPGDEPASG